MNRYRKVLLVCIVTLFALMIAVPAASARPRIFVGAGGFYGHGFYGPGWWGPGWYGAGWYGPAWYGPYGDYYAPRTDSGEVKIETRAKDALVYVDGAYAGKTHDLKSFRLKAGEHNIELRDPSGHAYYQERVRVLAGKTLKLQPDGGN